MNVQYNKTYSHNLGREMEWKQYGQEGQGVLVFPSQDQRFYEWEDNGMIDVLAPMIEAGKFHLICCDGIDRETWSVVNEQVDAAYREGRNPESVSYSQLIEQHERWFRYIVDELIPAVNHGQKLLVTGCSMGGYHAANVFFRCPELFDTLISLSGLFHADYFFPGFADTGIAHHIPEQCIANDLDKASDLIYHNSPLHYLQDSLLSQKTIILCCGQGAYERVTLPSTQRLGQLLEQKGIHTWVDIWGNDVSHDFYWWRKQAAYFFDKLFNQQLRIAA